MEIIIISILAISLIILSIIKYIKIQNYNQLLTISEIEIEVKEEKIKDLERNITEMIVELKKANIELHEAHRIINSNNLK